MTKYYITYRDFTDARIEKVISINAKDMNEARLYVIRRFLKDYIKKKPYIYKYKTATQFWIGTKEPNLKSRIFYDTGEMQFMKLPNGKVAVSYESSNQRYNYGFYEVDLKTGKLIKDSKVYW